MRDITIIIPTSVLPSHPDTRIIDETIQGVRTQLPDSEIIMQIDGLRAEQQDRLDDYNEYKRRVLWKCLHEWKNVLPVVFEKHSHQTTMLKETIDKVRTSLLLYVEGDAPLTPDLPIEWDKCINWINEGKANTIRFHFEARIPEEHNHLMLGLENGFMKTCQWSQRPHLSTVNYYKDIVMPTLQPDFFIEDTFHGIVYNDYMDKGKAGWARHRLWIYHPEGNIKRSYTTDGREGTRKFTSDDEVWGLV